MESRKKLHVIPGAKKGMEDGHIGHAAHILSMAISSDGKYLVRGGFVLGKPTWFLAELGGSFLVCLIYMR